MTLKDSLQSPGQQPADQPDAEMQPVLHLLPPGRGKITKRTTFSCGDCGNSPSCSTALVSAASNLPVGNRCSGRISLRLSDLYLQVWNHRSPPTGRSLPGLLPISNRPVLRRVNVSIDSLDPETYKKITGTDLLDDVLAGNQCGH